MRNLSISRLFLLLNGLIALFVVFIAGVSIRVFVMQIDLREHQQQRYQSYQLATELRQSSEDLSKLARAYVVTGDVKYEQLYQETLNIKEGRLPRADGRTIPLLQLIEQSGISPTEKELLQKAEKASNELNEIELKAMSAIKGLYEDQLGNYIKKQYADSALAQHLLFNDTYFRKKVKIIAPIEEFTRQLDKRTKQQVDRQEERITRQVIFLDILVVLTLLLLVSSFLIIRWRVLRRLLVLNTRLKEISYGDFSIRLTKRREDEIGQLVEAINSMSEALRAKSNFVQAIGQGHLDQQFDTLSDKDLMGQALLEMQASLVAARQEDEKRKSLDEQQNWASEGITQLNDVLRRDNDNIEKLAYSVVKHLVQYLNANQGGLFIINDEDINDKHLELTACMAYERQRRLKKRIELYEGLIGRVIDERQSIYMTDLPDDYINITSGLGDNPPRSLLIVPLISNEDIYGAFELATFEQLKDYQIRFMERAAENIAASIASVRIAAQTQRLLQESREYTEIAATQEEEMKQQMEELEATKEELGRKTEEQKEVIASLNRLNKQKIKELEERELQSKAILDALNATTLLMEYDFSGNILFATQVAADYYGIEPDKIIEMNINDFLDDIQDFERADLQELLERLKAGATVQLINCQRVQQKEVWLSETYMPVLDNENKAYKFLKVSHDISVEKQREAELERQMKDKQKEKEQQEQQRHVIEKSLRMAKEKEEKLKAELAACQEKLRK